MTPTLADRLVELDKSLRRDKSPRWTSRLSYVCRTTITLERLAYRMCDELACFSPDIRSGRFYRSIVDRIGALMTALTRDEFAELLSYDFHSPSGRFTGAQERAATSCLKELTMIALSTLPTTPEDA